MICGVVLIKQNKNPFLNTTCLTTVLQEGLSIIMHQWDGMYCIGEAVF